MVTCFRQYDLLFSGDEMFKVSGVAGSGAYAKVYSANKYDETHGTYSAAVALKVLCQSYSNTIKR